MHPNRAQERAHDPISPLNISEDVSRIDEVSRTQEIWMRAFSCTRTGHKKGIKLQLSLLLNQTGGEEDDAAEPETWIKSAL